MICPNTPEFQPVTGGEGNIMKALINQQTEQETKKLKYVWLL